MSTDAVNGTGTRRRRIVVSTSDGVHARPVAELARIAQAHPAPVTLSAHGAVVDLSSVLALMDLAIAPGDEVVVQTTGPGADEVLDAMGEVLAPSRER